MPHLQRETRLRAAGETSREGSSVPSTGGAQEMFREGREGGERLAQSLPRPGMSSVTLGEDDHHDWLLSHFP